MKDRLMRWLRKHKTSAEVDPVEHMLQRQGVSSEALQRAAEHRFVLRARLASTLVVQGELEETQALAALCQLKGVPGICIENSIVDVANNSLPEAFARDRLQSGPFRGHETD